MAKGTSAPESLWVDKSETLSTLDLGVIVMTVVGRKDDAWIVQSSHGAPTGEHPTKETAQRYAVKFAGSMIEKTLAALADLEATNEAATIGWRGRPCVLLVLSVPPSPEFEDENGGVRADVFEQKRQACIDDARANLRALLTKIKR